jgi:hypothetical protein
MESGKGPGQRITGGLSTLAAILSFIQTPGIAVCAETSARRKVGRAVLSAPRPRTKKRVGKFQFWCLFGVFWCVLVRSTSSQVHENFRTGRLWLCLVVFGCVPDKTNMNQGTVAQRLAAPNSNFIAVKLRNGHGLPRPQDATASSAAICNRATREGLPREKSCNGKFGKVSAPQI